MSRVEQELHGAGVLVADVLRERDRAAGDERAHLGRDRRRGRLLEHLLVAALGRAVALPQVDRVAVSVGDHLHLDVAAALDVLLDEEGVVAERAARLAGRGGLRLLELGLLADDAHALAATTGGRLHEHGESSVLASRHDRDAGCHGDLAGVVLARHRLHRLGRRADPDEAGVGDGAGEAGVLGQEAVAGVHGLGSGRERLGDLGGRVEVVTGADGRADAEPVAGAGDPGSDLAAVGDEDRLEHPHHIRKTPYDGAGIGPAWAAAARPMPRTRRVSAGSMIPSSHRRAVE